MPRIGHIAIRSREGTPPGLFWMGGFKSDMKGTKAAALDEWAEKQGRACTRFDYSGHGESSGAFEDGTIGQWLEDSMAAFATLSCPQVVVGSSMGGWMALLLARALKKKKMRASLAGLVLIAPAPDFTEDLIWEALAPAERAALMAAGMIEQPSAYGEEPYRITRGLIEDGRCHLLLRDRIAISRPVRLLQGIGDADVPWETAIRLAERLESSDVTVTLIKSGDHRLSTRECARSRQRRCLDQRRRACRKRPGSRRCPALLPPRDRAQPWQRSRASLVRDRVPGTSGSAG